MSAQIPSLQLVIELPVSNMGEAKGHVLVSGPWVGLLDHLDQDFFPRCTLNISSIIGFVFSCLSFVVY